MNWLTTQLTWIKPLGIVAGSILTIWSLLGHIDGAIVKHLDETFATKNDLVIVERKVDAILRRLDTIKPEKK